MAKVLNEPYFSNKDVAGGGAGGAGCRAGGVTYNSHQHLLATTLRMRFDFKKGKLE